MSDVKEKLCPDCGQPMLRGNDEDTNEVLWYCQHTDRVCLFSYVDREDIPDVRSLH